MAAEGGVQLRVSRRQPLLKWVHISAAAAVMCFQDGDMINIDAEKRVMDIENADEQELAARRAAWTAPPLKATAGTLYKYIKVVTSASEGCVTDA